MNGGGNFENSGSYTYGATTEQAHAGSWSWKGTVTNGGVRAFRWKEPRENRDAWYSAWLYIPVQYTPTGNNWNVFQFKTRSQDNSRHDPIWGLYGTRDAGGMFLRVGWGWGGTPLAGPQSGDPVGGRWLPTTKSYIPAGTWTKVEGHLYQSSASNFDGRLTFWVNGTQVFDMQNVRTGFNNCNFNAWCNNNEWSVNMYTDGLSPSPSSHYWDDAEIRR